MTTELRLNCDAIECKPIAIDWAESLGENMDGYEVFEASTCEGCNRVVVSNNLGEVEHRDLDVYLDVMVEGEMEEQRNECRSTIYNEGPMMNYWYPVKLDDCREAATKIAHLPLCVVRFEDGRTGLALTGGGMDLSWEIVEAFRLLGYWPPVHFCGLPRMTDRGASDKDHDLIRACMESCRIAEGWIASKREQLGEQLWPAPIPAKNAGEGLRLKGSKRKATRKRK